MEITYTQAEKEDIEIICRLSDDLIVRYEDFNSINKEKALGWTHKSISENIDRFTVIRCDGHKAGYYFISAGNGIYELRDLFVLPRYQGRGIGTQVIQQCIKDTGGNLQTYIFTGDLGTYSFFESLGFRTKEVYRRTRYLMVYQGEEPAEDEDDDEIGWFDI